MYEDGTTLYEWIDTDGKNYKEIELCKPNSLAGSSKNWGGLLLDANFDCDLATLFIQDGGTGFSYKGVSPDTTVTSVVISYPLMKQVR